MSQLRVTPKLVEALNGAFSAVDKDHDGRINKSEFELALSKLDLGREVSAATIDDVMTQFGDDGGLLCLEAFLPVVASLFTNTDSSTKTKTNKSPNTGATQEVKQPACPVFLCPAMNTLMWANPFTQEHIEKLVSSCGCHIIDPIAKKLACGDTGVGAMEEPGNICERIRQYIQNSDSLKVKAKQKSVNILVGFTGSVASIKADQLITGLDALGNVQAIVTGKSQAFIDVASLSARCRVYTDKDEWGDAKWQRGDSVLHIELRKWADILIIAPLSANTLALLASGMCPNLLTCVFRCWQFQQ